MYDGQKIIEIRNGSGTMVQQFIHGTQYIDELVMVRVKDKGDLYVHQDANWNVIGMTDLGRHLVERDVYSPYGELTVHQSTGYGDRDGDGDVDSTDKVTVGTTCTGTVSASCRILDLDFDGYYDSTDATKFDSLLSGLQRTPGRLASAVQQPFAHQGLLFEPEIGSYQNRARQYDPAKRRFCQQESLPTRRIQWMRGSFLEHTSMYIRPGSNPISILVPFALADGNGYGSMALTEAEACSEAISQSGGVGGITICFNGSAVGCVPPGPPGPPGPSQICAQAHEDYHASCWNCSPGPGWHVPSVPPDSHAGGPECPSGNEGECMAFKIEIGCLCDLCQDATTTSALAQTLYGCTGMPTCN